MPILESQGSTEAESAAIARRLRIAGIARGVTSGLGSRGVGVLVSLLSVPLTISYLGPERYGIWALIGSLFAWLNLADLGVSNGFTNMVVKAAGQGRADLVREFISTAFAMLMSISIIVALVAAAVWPSINWDKLFNIHTELARSEVNYAMIAATAIYLMSFPLAIVNRTYVSLQDGQKANYWDAAGNLASLCTLLIVTRTEGGLPWLVFAVGGASFLVRAASCVWLFSYRRELVPRLHLVSMAVASQMLRPGIQFFLIQILALIVFQTDNLVVAHYLGAAEVPSYNLTYRLFEFTTLLQSILFGYAWVGYADAISRRDYQWVEKTFALNLSLSIVFTIFGAGALIFIAKPFIGFWTRGAVSPPMSLVYWMAAWSLINAYCSPMASLLAAASRLRSQLVYSAVGASVNIVASIILVQRWGVTGAIAGTVIGYLSFICIPIGIDVIMYLRNLRNSSLPATAS
jgi:O-antigen/teichoic acid export membrane protein